MIDSTPGGNNQVDLKSDVASQESMQRSTVTNNDSVKSQRSNFTGHDSTKVAIENEKEMGTIDSRSTRLDVVEANDVESGPMKVSQEPTPLDETGEIMSNLVVEAGQDDTETSGSQNCTAWISCRVFSC